MGSFLHLNCLILTVINLPWDLPALFNFFARSGTLSNVLYSVGWGGVLEQLPVGLDGISIVRKSLERLMSDNARAALGVSWNDVMNSCDEKIMNLSFY